MRLVFDLQDHEGKSHRTLKYEFYDWDTIDRLERKIYLTLKIETEYQEVFHDDELILLQYDTLKEAGIKHTDTLIVKHTFLSRWVACQEFSERLKKAGSENVKLRIAKQGSEILRSLKDVKFLAVYPSFSIKFMEMLELFDRFVFGVEKSIKLATSHYFKNYYKNDALKMDFLAKPHGGAQGELICKIQDAEEFFVKNHTFMISRGSQHSRFDCREIFVYHLLHLIGVGPEPHFIPDAYSKPCTSYLALHIATKKVPGFNTCADRASCHLTSHDQLQLDMLKRLLYLDDLNSGNYGLDEEKKLVIIDFMIQNLTNCVHHPSEISDFMEKNQQEECKEILTKWNILENFNEAKSVAKTDFDRLSNIDWKEGYETYLEAVVKNIELMMKLVNF